MAKRRLTPQRGLRVTLWKELNTDVLRAMAASFRGLGSGGGVVTSETAMPGMVSWVSRFMNGLNLLRRNFVECARQLFRELKTEMEALLGALATARQETVGHCDREQAAVMALGPLRGD